MVCVSQFFSYLSALPLSAESAPMLTWPDPTGWSSIATARKWRGFRHCATPSSRSSAAATTYTHIEPVVVSRNTRKADEMQNRSSDTDLQFVTASDWLEAALRNEGPGGGATNYDEWAYEQVLPPVSDDED